MSFLSIGSIICLSLVSSSLQVRFICFFNKSVDVLKLWFYQLSTPESPTYTAAVIEYHKLSSLDDPEQLVNNLNEYRRIINHVDVSLADIIVFPESTLNSIHTAVYLPDAEDLVVPCGNTSFHELVSKTSCAAISERKYIVINVKEKTDCPDKQQIAINDPRPCDANKTNVYNTNVVFDRQGFVIAKYRKFNLFGEKGTLKPYKHDVVTFTTDFNVTFGMFVCFDLMFEHPPLDLVRNGVKDIIFSANWFSEIPFLSGL